MSRLDELVSRARESVRERSSQISLADLEAQLSARDGGRPFKEALVRPGLSVIAEFKRRSPSAGEINGDAALASRVAAYERGGAAALSILTEPSGFGGRIEDLRDARGASALPILRKDFVVDRYQLAEAAVHGADAVLLIATALSGDELSELYARAHELDLDAVVEVHDERDLEAALEMDADVIGINNRNLADFTVDPNTTERLIVDVPAGKTVVAESGYDSREQVEELERIGVDAVLIGEALMRADDPERAVREFAGEPGTREHDVIS